MADIANADQIAYWNSEAGVKWATLQTRIDEVFSPITAAVLGLAGPQPGEHIIDIGCGCGATTLALAQHAGASGSVLGVDISEPMLAVADRRIAAAGLSNARTVRADASGHAFAGGSIDLVASRFGVMFFDDPAAAFANIRRALKPRGRLAFACWRPMRDVPLFLVPYSAAKPYLPEQPKPDPDAPGPFAFADPERVRAILSAAGFSDIEITARDVPLDLGAPEAAVEFAIKLGPASRALAEADEATRHAAEAAIRAAIVERAGGGGVTLDAGLWLVRATG